MLKPVEWIILAALIAACGGATMPSTTSTPKPAGPPTMWTTMQSPVFPSEWPPTSSTLWVRYTFAYGSNPSVLVDGAYVTRPLSRVEVNRQGQIVVETDLHNPLESISTQGIVPLTAQQKTTLDKRGGVEQYILQLTTMSAGDASATTDLLEFYRLWIKFNGAFTRQIRPDHAAFFDWLEAGQ